MFNRILIIIGFVALLFPSLQAENGLVDTIMVKAMIDSLVNAPHSEASFAKAQQIEEYAQQIDYSLGIIFAKNRMADYYRRTGQYEQSLLLFQHLHDLAETNQDEMLKSDSYYGLGVVYSDMNEFDKSNEYLNKALVINERYGDKERKGKSIVGIGTNYLKNRNQEAGLSAMLKAKELFVEAGVPEFLPVCNNNIGITYVQKGEASKALPFFKEHLIYIKTRKDTIHFAGAYGNLAYAYQNLLDFKNAFIYYDSSLYFSETLGQDEVSYITYLDISDAYVLKDDFENALLYQKKYHDLYRKVFNEKNKGRIDELEVKFDTEKKERELLATQKEVTNLQLKQQRMWMLIGSLIAFLMFVFFIFKKAKSDAQKKRELQKVQNQLIRSELKNKELATQKLQGQLENKQSDLTNLALDIGRKNEFSTQLLKQLEQLQKAKTDTIKSQLREVTSFATNHLQINEDLALLQENVEKINRAFYQKLDTQFGNLSANEKYLSGLIRLNLSNKDIAAIKGISVSSAKMNRYRLRKKLTLKPDEDIVVFLQRL